MMLIDSDKTMVVLVLFEKIVFVVLVLKGDEGFASKMGQIKGIGAVLGKLLA